MTLAARIARHPRAGIALAATPLEPLPRLSDETGGPVWVKRDDALPIAFGGNKVRQLDFYIGAALAEGADTVLITGAVQSNFCRLTAAIAARLGLACHIQAEERVPDPNTAYRRSGNVLVERLTGAVLHPYPTGEDEAGADAALMALAERLRGEGRVPYVIPLGPGHPPLGSLGYVLAAEELLRQMREAGLERAEIVVASGSGATHAGLLFGLRALGSGIPVTGVCVRRAVEPQRARIAGRAEGLAALLGVANPVAAKDIRLTDRVLAPGYGRLNLPAERALLAAARREGLMLDPVYTAKAMAGALTVAGTGGGRPVVFVHTGGTPALFAYEPALSALPGMGVAAG